MGTSDSGRYRNTRGSEGQMSDRALAHAAEGEFTGISKKTGTQRLNSGGHGESGLQVLAQKGIKAVIVKTYENGVRIGHVEDHKKKAKATGVGQSWFPSSWSDSTIRQAAEHVAQLEKNQCAADGVIMRGKYLGVLVCVIKTNGRIATAFPDCNQPEEDKE